MGIISKAEEDKEAIVNFNQLGLFAAFEIPFFIWGVIALFRPGPCAAMKTHGLYTWAMIMYWTRIIYLLGNIGACLYVSHSGKGKKLARMEVGRSEA
jgi:hypothetical protein